MDAAAVHHADDADHRAEPRAGDDAFLRETIARAGADSRRRRNQFIALAFLSGGLTSYLYWGLGYALGPMIAIYFAAEAERRGIDVDFPFLLAVTTAAQALWQYGLSSSAPLLVASQGHFLQDTIGVIPLSTTIWSPAAIIHEAASPCAAIMAACWMMPKRVRPDLPLSRIAGAGQNRGSVAAGGRPRGLSFSQRLEQSPLVTLAMARRCSRAG